MKSNSSMRFSERTSWNSEESDLAVRHRQRIADGLSVADLTASNPTRCGFDYPADLLETLSDPRAFDYDPNPKGALRAREAICRYYADHQVQFDPGQMILTTSTSEAYSYLFKLLCNPDDTILVPQPCYPLFDFLADAEVVRLAACDFVYDHGWQLDFESLRKQTTPTTRAVVLVHPNNPTGHFTSPEQSQQLAAFCREHNLAIIVDEVFLDYPLNRSEVIGSKLQRSFAASDLGVLTFVVSGISKIVGLPQMKAAWLLATGPGAEEALSRLEVLADTYLSMNAPIQSALPTWLGQRGQMQTQILARLQTNLSELDRQLSIQHADQRWVSRLTIEGGWYAILRIPAKNDDEFTALALLDRGVLTHPGHFFGMPRSGWLVISLLGESREFSNGFEMLLAYFHENQESYQPTKNL